METDIKLNNQVKILKNNFYQLDKDLEARDLFLSNFKKSYKKFNSFYDRVKFLVNNKYYSPKLLKYFSKNKINNLRKQADLFRFEFKSYMAIKKFLNEYALSVKDKDGNIVYYENYEDRVVVLGMYLSQGNYKFAEEIIREIMSGRYQPATPTMQDAGRINSGEMISCFLLEMDDNLNSINYNLGVAMHLSKLGGGVAVNLSNIRPRGSKLKNVKSITSGIMPILKLLEDSFSFANKLDQRNGAGAAYLNIFHADILEFLDTKKINADEKNRLQFLSLGVIIPNKFFELAKQNKQIALFSTYDIKKYYKKNLDDINLDKHYEVLEKDIRIFKKYYSARKLLLKIAETQLQSGYPYIMYKDNANKVHPLKEIGQIKMSNLCTEIFQLQETSIIQDYESNKKNKIKRDILCNLGSLNIVKIMENKDMKQTVKTAMRALTAVSDINNLTIAPGVKKANNELHAVGLGALNLHGYLAKNKIVYDSETAKEFCDIFFSAVNFYSIEASMELAKKRHKKFKGFKKSEYAKGTYFKPYLEKDFLPKTDRVKMLFKDMVLPTKENWLELMTNVRKYGLYNAYRLAIAPNQSTAYIANATPSVMPITAQVEARTYGNSTTYYPMPYLKKETSLYYKTAYNTSQEKIIDLIATIQKHIDQGISTILYVNNETSTRDLAKLYIYANAKGLKALYYTRTKNLKLDECESCFS